MSRPSIQEQLEKLFALQRVIGAYEVNTVMNHDPEDVPFVAAVDVPNASQICFASGQGYDAWRRRGGRLRPVEINLSVGDAANIVIVEYMTEKISRAKQNDPSLRRYSDAQLLTHLLKGYQSTGASVPS